ncbi:MAG: hypothetical protein EA426_05705 [Spirochaetaceae bacterium]|nr:MAG: hypothetical protein EA426_05705 [Spirochaetaceae bacterium]
MARTHSLLPSLPIGSSSDAENTPFHPPFCPNPCCLYHHAPPPEDELWWRDHGRYRTKIAGRIRRLRCRRCGRTFSERTFSTAYYIKVQINLVAALLCLVGGMSLRAIARGLGCSMGSLSNRFARMGRQAAAMHAELAATVSLAEDLCADGFVDFTVSQYFPDVTTVLVGSRSQMIYSLDHGFLRRRGRMTARQRRRRARLERLFRAARSAEKNTFACALAETLERNWNPARPLILDTDKNPLYPRALAALAKEIPAIGDPKRFHHRVTSGEAPRTHANHLFPVNYIDRQIRLNLAAHRRQTVCFARNTAATLDRTVLLMCYHNYNKAHRIVDTRPTPSAHAVVAGVDEQAIIGWWRRFFLSRTFFTHTSLSGFLRSVWLRTNETPLSKAPDYLPKYAFA